MIPGRKSPASQRVLGWSGWSLSCMVFLSLLTCNPLSTFLPFEFSAWCLIVRLVTQRSASTWFGAARLAFRYPIPHWFFAVRPAEARDSDAEVADVDPRHNGSWAVRTQRGRSRAEECVDIRSAAILRAVFSVPNLPRGNIPVSRKRPTRTTACRQLRAGGCRSVLPHTKSLSSPGVPGEG